MNEEQIIDLAYGHIIAAYNLLADADLFDEMCIDVSHNYDAYLEEIDEEEYNERLLALCNNGK